MEKLKVMLEAVGVPYAYNHFAQAEAPEPPFIVFMTTGSDNFSADGKVYAKINEWEIELYTTKKDIELEARVEAVLNNNDIFWDKTEVWIQSQSLYQIIYQFDLEG